MHPSGIHPVRFAGFRRGKLPFTGYRVRNRPERGLAVRTMKPLC
jgi:hypothetical protein